jgi:hypothetical protein
MIQNYLLKGSIKIPKCTTFFSFKNELATLVETPAIYLTEEILEQKTFGLL